MRRPRRLRTKGTFFASVLVAATLLVPATSTAVVSTGCGGEHLGGTSTCTFMPSGVAFQVVGYVTDSSESVYVTIENAAGLHVGHCYGTGDCEAQFFLIGVILTELPVNAGGPYTCRVMSAGQGFWRCASWYA